MNRVTIEPTKFVNVRGGAETYGYRIFDSYCSVYDNTLESIPDDNLELLKIVVENDNDVVQDMLEYLVETESGLEIGDTYYDFDEVKHLL